MVARRSLGISSRRLPGLFKYPGSKWKLAPKIVALFPTHTCYVEPFVGTGSVFFLKQPSTVEVLNDLDDEITNFFRVLRDPKMAEQLQRLITLTPYSRTGYNKAAHEIQKRRSVRNLLDRVRHGISVILDPDRRPFCTIESLERAQQWYLKCQCGFMPRGPFGYGRTLSPVGQFRSPQLKFREFSSRLSSAIIENDSALNVIRRYDSPETLFYCDPPYVLSPRDTNVYRFEMTTANHEKMCDILTTVAGMVILNAYPNRLYSAKLAGWHKLSFRTRMSLAIKPVNSARTENIWMNPGAYNRLRAERKR